jgi:hypothetical protein
MNQVNSLLRLFLILKPLAYGVAVASGLVLALTGFGPGLLGAPLHGLVLMAHMGCVMPFLLSIAFLGITCAKQHDLKDRVTVGSLCFWTLLLLSVPLTLTIIVIMLPLVGTDGQRDLLEVHELVSFLFVGVAVIYSLLRWGGREGPQSLEGEDLRRTVKSG